MKKIVDIRYALNEIRDVWVNTPPESSVIQNIINKTLWESDVSDSELSTKIN